MNALRAHVRNGRLVLDEPTDLPEGEVVYLQPMNAVVPSAEAEFDEDEQARLESAIDDGITSARRGEHVDAQDFIRGLLSRE